ncbi:hypothetical protein D3C86_1981400 [compost metagenome]
MHIRVAIACRYSEAAVGLYVSRANALATPVLLVTLTVALLLQTSATRFARGHTRVEAVGA